MDRQIGIKLLTLVIIEMDTTRLHGEITEIGEFRWAGAV